MDTNKDLNALQDFRKVATIIHQHLIDTEKYKATRGYVYLATLLTDAINCDIAIDLLLKSTNPSTTYIVLKAQIEKILVLYKRYVAEDHINEAGRWLIEPTFTQVYDRISISVAGSNKHINCKSSAALVEIIQAVWDKSHGILQPDKIGIKNEFIRVHTKFGIVEYNHKSRICDKNVLMYEITLIRYCLSIMFLYVLSIGAKL